jgi:hypothetical protein
MKMDDKKGTTNYYHAEFVNNYENSTVEVYSTDIIDGRDRTFLGTMESALPFEYGDEDEWVFCLHPGPEDDDGIHPRADRIHIPLQVLRDIVAYTPAKVKD